MSRWLILNVLLLALVISQNGMAGLPIPKDRPTDATALGNARVLAWRSLRLDLDSLNQGEMHPSLVHQWIETAPATVLRHIAGHSMDPSLVLLALNQLVRIGAKDSAFIDEVIRQWRGLSNPSWFDGLRVANGDGAYIRAQESQLTAPSPVIRIRAAQVLAIGGNRRGKDVLLQEVDHCGPKVETAAQTLAQIGDMRELALIEKSLAAGCQSRALPLAVGEMLFRRLYPLYYELLNRRDPGKTRYQATDGLYAAWFDMVRVSRTEGVGTVAGLISWLKQFRRFSDIWPAESPEVMRRNADALVDFLEFAAMRIEHRSPKAPWPGSWTEAMTHLADESRDAFGTRNSAAFAVLLWTEDIAGPEKYRATDAFTVLSPRGARVLDDNFQTSWQGMTGDSLVLEWFPASRVDTLWLASGCAQHSKNSLTRVVLRITTAGGTEEKSVKINPHHLYFQPLSPGNQLLEKVEIRIDATSQKLPACITEVRASAH